MSRNMFSQFSFSSAIPVEKSAPGHYVPVVEGGLVANPVIAIYSRYDTANKYLYPLGMSLASPTNRYEIGGSDDTLETYQLSKNRFGSIGANGAQGLEETSYRAIDMPPRDQTYDWDDLTGVSCLNVDGQQFINKGGPPVGAHNDNSSYEIFYLALTISLR